MNPASAGTGRTMSGQARIFTNRDAPHPPTEQTNSMKKIRIGFAGAGFAASFHLESLRRVYGVEVEPVGVVSLRQSSREAFARRHGLTAYDTLDAMLDRVDVLDIVSPPYAHEAAILKAVAAGKGVICEKPLTGYFGPSDADESYRGDRAPKREMLRHALASLKRIARAVRDRGAFFAYAENYVYAPSVQKEREIIEKTGAQILRMFGEESHNGSASSAYGVWRLAGGGSLMGKGCHPLSGMLYLKRAEGLARNGCPIRPVAVSARTHQLTRLPAYRDAGFIRTDYHDIEDYGMMHVTFEDGTICDALTSEVVLGGLYDYVEVFANNHRTRCPISPAGLMDTYNPRDRQFKDVYLIEKASTKEGWSPAAPDELFTVGYIAEMQDFIQCVAGNRAPQSGLDLALDTIAAIYAAYLSDEKKGAEIAVEKI
jgi:predicted dehydrogenase